MKHSHRSMTSPAQLALDTADPAMVGLPSAARLQGAVAKWDETLTALARRNRPGCFWWWGVRVIDNQSGAFCYVCEEFMCTFDRRWPITLTAVDSIGEHRAGHYPDAQTYLETA